MNIKGGQIGEVRFTLQIKRKDTGKVDKYDLVGTIQQQEHKKDVGNDFNRSA